MGIKWGMASQFQWRVPLGGREEDMDRLATLFDTGAFRVAREADGRVLIVDAFADLQHASEVRSLADHLLGLMNGAAELELGGHQPVTVA